MPAPQVQPLPPVAAAPASAGGRQPSGRLGGSPTRGRAAPVLRSRRARHVLLAGLAIFMVVNGALATRALYRAWAASDRGREAGGLGDTAVAVADDSVAAVMDSAAALKHAAGATVHTARAAGQAAGAAVGIVAPLAMHAARTAAQGMGAAAQGAGELAAATVDGSSLAANQTAARNDSAAGEEQARTESRPKRQARELPASHVANESNDACAQVGRYALLGACSPNCHPRAVLRASAGAAHPQGRPAVSGPQQHVAGTSLAPVVPIGRRPAAPGVPASCTAAAAAQQLGRLTPTSCLSLAGLCV